MYFDAINEKEQEAIGVKAKKPKEDEDFFPSHAIEGLERMRGTLIFRIKRLQKELNEINGRPKPKAMIKEC